MEMHKIPFAAAHIGSPVFHAYLSGQPVSPAGNADLQGVLNQIEQREKHPVNREKLADAFLEQYQRLGIHEESRISLIESLRHPDTYTVITGHQPCLLTGPAYFIYKIVSVIQLTRQLKQARPDLNFVPVYWMNAEDHDFDEISVFHLFGRTIRWEKPVDTDASVGSMPARGIVELLEPLKAEFSNMPEMVMHLEKAISIYARASDYGTAHLQWVDYLFREVPVLVYDQQQPDLKRLVWEKLEADFYTPESYTAVQKRTAEWAEKGWNGQVIPREVNFFYHAASGRRRLVWENDTMHVLGTDLQWTREAWTQEWQQHPERISTNVITRPLYQQLIFPNLAYVGGPAEVHYWLQLTGVFEVYNAHFPSILMRDSFLAVRDNQMRKWSGLGFEPEDLFRPEAELEKEYALRQPGADTDLQTESEAVEQLFEALKKRAGNLDKTLVASVEGEKQKSLQALKNIEGKFVRAVKNQHQQQLQIIRDMKAKTVFPEGVFQERHDHIFQLHAGFSMFLQELLTVSNCLDARLKVLKI